MTEEIKETPRCLSVTQSELLLIQQIGDLIKRIEILEKKVDELDGDESTDG